MVSQRLPEVANDIVTQLTGESEGCLAELQGAACHLDRCGFVGRPSWEALKAGARPPVPKVTEPGEWLHGWQHHASSSSEYHHRETWCCLSRLLLIRISGRTQVQVRVPSSTVRVSSAARVVPHVVSREDEVATPVHRSSM